MQHLARRGHSAGRVLCMPSRCLGTKIGSEIDTNTSMTDLVDRSAQTFLLQEIFAGMAIGIENWFRPKLTVREKASSRTWHASSILPLGGGGGGRGGGTALLLSGQ